jgi:hypothetical protein
VDELAKLNRENVELRNRLSRLRPLGAEPQRAVNQADIERWAQARRLAEQNRELAAKLAWREKYQISG